MTLPNDIASCDGSISTEDDQTYWREGSETCLRRTAKRQPGAVLSFIEPPRIIAFECEYLIEP